MTEIKALAERTAKEFPQLVSELKELVRIPSVSSLPEHLADVHRSAEHVRALFAGEGFETEILVAKDAQGKDGMPAVVGHKHVGDDFPTVLLYAHHDVQPAGDTGRWSSDPFEPVIKDDRMFGRGASDDGAGIIVHLGALRVLGEKLKCNITVFIEGEEEIGSPSFRNFLQTYQDRLGADRIIVADSSNWKAGEPAATTSLRGLVDAFVNVKVLDHAVHSGMFGGPILDAVTLASRLIATLHDEKGEVAVVGLGGSERADVVLTEDDLRKDAGIVDSYELAGTGDLAARMWTKPAIGIVGFDATSVANAANVIAPECRFMISMRTVPGADGQTSYEALKAHLEVNAPFGAEVTVTKGEIGPSYKANLEAQSIKDAHWAFEQAWGKKSVNIGIGGSIPFITDFTEVFPDAQVVVTGVEDPKTNAHSENESQYLPDLQAAILAEALLLQRTAGVL